MTDLSVALARMPHRGPMLLIERVLEADETTIRCQARDHREPAYPLRIDGKLPMLALVELGAQAAAAHASLFGVGGAHAGVLLSLEGVSAAISDADAVAGPLIATAERLHADPDGARYAFCLWHKSEPVLEGRAMLRMQLLGD